MGDTYKYQQTETEVKQVCILYSNSKAFITYIAVPIAHKAVRVQHVPEVVQIAREIGLYGVRSQPA